jgi:uncharacterized protein (TIGR02246 family)
MEKEQVSGWVGRYRDAWESNDPVQIGTLFTPDGTYFTEPYAEPWTGREEIVRGWLEQRDEPGTTDFEYDVLAIDGDLGIVKGSTVYRNPPREYSNLWEVRLRPDGTCTEFTEWWMEKK